MTSPFDRAMMQRCLTLARRAQGQTAPNPMVGAVIVQEGAIIGEGFHPGAGQPHAEVFALEQAGDRAQGATIYVSLEPCNHHGRTPPCSEALVKAQVSKVIIGTVDPNPKVGGGGIARLQEAGIEVIVGVEEADCRRLNEAFFHRITEKRPFGILKYAMTLDGKIASQGGHSAWVTGTAARQRVHQLRGHCEAVIVGGNTVRNDNPHLTCHNHSPKNPLRVVMSRRLDLPPDARLWDVSEAPTLVATETGTKPEFQNQLRDRGVEVLAYPHLTPSVVMEDLYQRGMMTVLWECGGVLAARALSEGMIQKVMAFIAPKLIGGNSAPTPLADLGFNQMTDALPLQNYQWHPIGEDLLLEGYL
ncbi:bifunctional diaminohydroxyphosphoribosylaminopyrimidine deaminase/5-amino-6-(5-phosphoribosylamino)uracil reductase RibD [Sodalinema gerasimenkoae]|uniref:bifunctional diaminohydroxyphosphoribosylaminopyrimidine deaminase/5-amino-6-(5-phosphoribosylamino)uracil reductase RibD n=1 Tax=Sodalinema gerasimenkoae TaxID=2862348 RepID=UPI00135CAEC8|nr:bifunctional diaminohydroxyphosphoribosylaminopyrimidine deaminase/5-amino-6-(5-phosphoribosylamino)uracil reductase RibD [Sodalinema gerasimenkoae]